ncbi:MAG: PAS domain S-box protein, partial [Thermodesulfobacteriota bacterium]
MNIIDLRWRNLASNWLDPAQGLAVLLLFVGSILFALILFLYDLRPEMVIHSAVVLEGLFAFFMGLALLTIAFRLYKGTESLQNRVWILAILGLGLLYIYAAADFADNFVVTPPGGKLALLEGLAKLLGVAVLVISVTLWIRELLQTQQVLQAREESLGESEIKFRRLFELYPVATLLINPDDGLPEDFNQVAPEQLGYTAQEFATMSISDYEALETPEETHQHIEHIKEHGRDDFETKHRCRDGSLIDVHVTVMFLEIGSKSYLLCVFSDITELKNTIQALEESEQRFRDVAEAAGEYIWEIDPQGKYSFLTSKVEDLLGRKVDEILDYSPFDFMPQDEAERVERMLAGWAERGESWQGLEHQSIRVDDKIVWQRVSGMPILDSQGQLIGFRGTGLDITAEKEARQAQQELSERLRLAAEAAELGIWDLRLSDNYLEWDEGMFRIYGKSREEFSNSVQDWLDSLLPEFQEKAPQDVQKGITDGQAYKSEFKIRRGDGDIRHIRAMAQPIFDDSGNPVRVVGINEDITESKRAEERLHEQERLYRGLVESQQDLIVRVDNQGRFTYVNDVYCKLFGKGREELLGTSFTPLIHEEDIEATFAAMQDLYQPPYRAYIEQQAMTVNGWCWLSWEYSAVLDDQGQVIEIQGVGRDITALKEMQREAEAANQAKSEFLANMSHEIRTPMNAVIGLIQLLQQTPVNDQQRDYLSKINSSSRMLLGIINDILDYSKIEAGKLELDTHAFRVDELLDQMKTLFSEAAVEKGLDIFFRVSPDVPNAVAGDSLRLGQVLTNLLGNAVKFTEKGQVELVVERSDVRDQRTEVGSQKAEAGDQGFEEGQQVASSPEVVRLRFEIRDTGIGMDKDQLSRLFQAFSQADTSTTRRYGGTGLGLIISQKLVQRMGGSLHVDSTPGEGSTFFFELDLPVSRKEERAPECREMKGMRALVVDDQAPARQVLRQILENCGCEVTEAANGQEAVQAVVAVDNSESFFDFIFMDWKMPGELDGLGAIQRIETMHANRELKGQEPPVIIVSAYKKEDMPEISSEYLKGFLSKPVTASSVFDAMSVALGHAPESELEPSGTMLPSFAGASILLAEDNILNQEVAQNMLEKTGATVTLANNGAEAVQMVAAGSFDLVLMDLQMPVMDGFEATRKILEEYPEVPVIALSAAVMEADQRQARQAGMKAHLAKPIDSAELYRTLSKWLQVQQGSQILQTGASADDSGLPEYMEGFDLDQGLKSTDGDAAFYLKMLYRFKEQLEGEFAFIDDKLQQVEN